MWSIGRCVEILHCSRLSYLILCSGNADTRCNGITTSLSLCESFITIEISYNQPKLPGCPRWDPDGITFANEIAVGQDPLDIFVDRNNTVYVTNEFHEQILIWSVDSVILTTIILDRSFEPWGLFVTINGDIYIGSDTNHQVEKWTPDGIRGTVVMNVPGSCAGLFVDIKNYLYCSVGDRHQILKQSLDNDSSVTVIVAGNGSQGLANNMLNGPRGIFVTITFDLYVADCWNNRVQLFKSGKQDGMTVAGSTSTSSIRLDHPTAVFLDADDYLFIIDNGNHRVLGLGSNGFYCIAGCSSNYGPTSSHLYFPYGGVFDNYGNIFIADQDNNRIQKFILMTNTSSK